MLSRWTPAVRRRAALLRSTHLYWSLEPQTRLHFLSRGSRPFHTTRYTYQEVVPLRKELKDTSKAARQTRREGGEHEASTKVDIVPGWELTVGIEIHAQLNTARKLFSDALTDPSLEPNSRTAEFDLSLPGSQPIFQYATLIPALRAAIALNCQIQPESRFDRKHYFYHDQPSGYQITQYYHPLAKDGAVLLDATDGLEDGQSLIIGIKQLQLEQDTARTQDQDASTTLIDFNRAGHPLIEIISLPQLHSPRIAAAYVRKIQSLLFAVDAVTTGMELGGLRADVNVSVRPTDPSSTSTTASTPTHSYGGITNLGQRTEIKNLSTLKGIEDAIRAERDRQIALLSAGTPIQNETRGWSLSHPNTTRRLRGKEGEVDYRYMPDPDIPPLFIAADLVHHLADTLPPIPEQLAAMLVNQYGLSAVDAWALLALDEGKRLDYFQDVVEALEESFAGSLTHPRRVLGKAAANWVLHDLGALLTMHERTWTAETVPAGTLAEIVSLVLREDVTSTSGKQLLKLVFEGDGRSVGQIVQAEGLAFDAMSDGEYETLVEGVLAEFPGHVSDIVEKGKVGKVKFLLGQVMRKGEKGRVEARVAEGWLRERLGLDSGGN